MLESFPFIFFMLLLMTTVSARDVVGITIHENGGEAHIGDQSPQVLFSMTTTLHIPGKEAFAQTALESFIAHHPYHRSLVKRYLIINEYSEEDDRAGDSQPALTNIRSKFPFVDTYQKGAHEQGQARSLNIILQELRAGKYAYWLHVEESWYTVRPFLAPAVRALESHPYLHHLQLYHAEYYINHTHTRITEDIKVIALNSHVDLTGADPHNWMSYRKSWPSYSLRPSLTRVEFLRTHPDLTFDARPESFPVVFELDFAIRWQILGGSMCALIQPAVARQPGHRSTYTLRNDPSQQ